MDWGGVHRMLATTFEEAALALAYEEVSRAECCKGTGGIDPEEGHMGHASPEERRAYVFPTP